MINPDDREFQGDGSLRTTAAPPVVAAMVVCQPGAWFREAVEALANQTYPELQSLFFIVDGATSGLVDVAVDVAVDVGANAPVDPVAVISSLIPQAVIRRVSGNPGYGAVINEVSRLVEGDGGFFCLLHDDIALEPRAIEQMVEEVFRSNAGVVGPKLVDWDNPTILQSVGIHVDRIGEIEPTIGLNEKDQEQHDSVRDVFALSSACLLIRSDLFRELGGFDRHIEFFGEDIDLCWRVHLSGARVLIVPAAKARHRNRMDTRTDVQSAELEQARNRVRSVVTLSGRWQLPLVVLQMLLISVGQVVVGLFGGGLKSAVASLRATCGVVFDIPYILRRRAEIRPLRRVAASEIHALQVAGSARLTSFFRRRSRRIQQAAFAQRDTKEAIRHQRTVSIVSIVVVCFVLVGSRGFVTDGLQHVGEFLPLREGSESARNLATSYFSGWTNGGFGVSGSNPTGMMLTAVSVTAFFGQLGALQTLSVVGFVLVGIAGMWRVPAGFFSIRARVVGMVMYAANPLPYLALNKGRFSVLVVYAMVPWVLRMLVRAESDVRGAKKTQMLAASVLLAAVVSAFVPSFLSLLVWLVLLWVAGGAIAKVARDSLRGPVQLLGVMLVGALVLNAPWSSEFINARWLDQIVGLPADSLPRVGLAQLAQFDGGYLRIGIVALGLYVPVFVSVIVTRSATFVWATRSLLFVVATGLLLVLVDADVISIPTPDLGMMLVVVACGVSLGAASLAGFVFDDELSVSYRWWKPIVGVSVVASLVGMVPALSMGVSGSWGQSKTTVAQLYVQMQQDPPEGDYNVLYIGNRLSLPLPSEQLADDVFFVVADDGELTFSDRWSNASPLHDSVRDAMLAVINRQTVRSGRLLAPLAVRYVVVPIIDGAESTVSRPLVPPSDLLRALATQLDFRRVYQASDLVIYENAAWLPSLAVVDAQTAELSKQAGDEVLLSSPLGAASPIARSQGIGSDVFQVEPSTVHFAVPFSERLKLEVNGEAVGSRVAFGGTTAFDVEIAGSARVVFDTPITRYIFVLIQMALWLIVITAMFDLGRFTRRVSGLGER